MHVLDAHAFPSQSLSLASYQLPLSRGVFVIRPKILTSCLSLAEGLSHCTTLKSHPFSCEIFFLRDCNHHHQYIESTIDVTQLTNPPRAPAHQEDSTCVRHSSFLSRFFPFEPLIQNLFGFVFCWVFSRYHWSEFAYVFAEYLRTVWLQDGCIR